MQKAAGHSVSPAAKWRYELSRWIFIGCGIWLVALGFYFSVVRPPLLPEDLRLMGTTLTQARAALPGLESWLQKVFVVMGAFMAGTGVLTTFVAASVLRMRLKGASWVLALAGASTVVTMSAVNFAIQSDFRWLLVAPVVIWFAGLVLYIGSLGRSNEARADAERNTALDHNQR